MCDRNHLQGNDKRHRWLPSFHKILREEKLIWKEIKNIFDSMIFCGNVSLNEPDDMSSTNCLMYDNLH